jgi:hypothetical protein
MTGNALLIDKPGAGGLSESPADKTHWAGFAHRP